MSRKKDTRVQKLKGDCSEKSGKSHPYMWIHFAILVFFNSSLSADQAAEKHFPQPVIFSICRVSDNQSLRGIHPGGVNICEHQELLGETDSEERVKSPSHTDGLFRATCLSMAHLQCDIRVWPGPLGASVSLSNSMRTNPELQRMYAVKARPSHLQTHICLPALGLARLNTVKCTEMPETYREREKLTENTIVVQRM